MGTGVEPPVPGQWGGGLGLAANQEVVCSRQRMECLHSFPISHPQSHPAECFHVPSLMSSWQRESGKLLGSPDIYIPLMAWRISRLIYVKLCSNNSLSRRPTNPLDYAFGVCHLNWLPHVEWHEGGGNLCIFQSGRSFIIYCWERMDRLLLILMLRGWLLGLWNKYFISKDHFVACSRQPSQVFTVCLWFTPHDSVNSARETCA